MSSQPQIDLVGHNCPLGVYPSVVVPVLKTTDGLAVAYWSEALKEATLVLVDSGSVYELHAEETKKRLANFDHRRDGLFAFSKADVRSYRFTEAKRFWRELLRSRDAGRIDPFYRLSLAQQTEDSDLIDECLDTAMRMMRVDCPQFAAEWFRRNKPRSDLQYEQTGTKGVRVSESDVRRLLDQVYNFKINHHHSNTTKSRVSWHWLHEGKILVPDVVGWSLLPGGSNSFNPEDIAAGLGLEMVDLESAIAGTYAQSCLLLALFISQLHRHLEIMAAQHRQNLLLNSSSLLSKIDAATFGRNCRSLIRKYGRYANDIMDHPETGSLGQQVLKILAGL